MRAIKFRAWDKVNKRYIYIADESNDTAIWFDENGWYVVDTFTGSPVELFNNKNGELEQSTGIKDKNGKEIYVGDIVNYVKESNFTSDKTYLYGGEVYYDNFTASYRMKECEYPLIFKGYKIIGNKFENPELLG